ncbi:MAG: hypothetical protein J7K37_03725 [Candidatus Omnitrophica bacterium]|nr:hypothetical protein [Candidatus Omnitrophota bacterium]
MKRLILLSLVTLLCLPLAVYAASIGKTETIGQGKWDIGVDTELIFDRDIKAKLYSGSNSWSGNISPTEIDYEGIKIEIEGTGVNLSGAWNRADRPDIDRLSRPVIKITYGLLDNLDFYLKLGLSDGKTKGGNLNAKYTGSATNFKIKIEGETIYDGAVNVSANLDANWRYKLKNAFLYGFGLKGVYPLEDNWLLGIDTSYIRHRNSYSGNISYTLSGDLSGQAEETWKGKMTFEEWQIAPYIAKKIENFIPYFGVKYSDLRLENKQSGGEKNKFKADDNFGVFLGTDYKINDAWALNFEARFIDETAISFGGTYRF